jgi:putative ABC transport system permease protein
MDGLLQDLRFGWRGLAKSPLFSAAAVLTLALGIGANTAVFSVVNAVLLRPLPFADPERLVSVRSALPGLGLDDAGFSVPELDDLAQRSGVFEQLAGVWAVDSTLTGVDHPQRVLSAIVSPTYFSLLGARAQLGRLPGPADATRGIGDQIVISDSTWRRLYGASPDALGRRLRMDNDVYTVIGVTEPGFRHPAPSSLGEVDMWATTEFHGNPFPSLPVRKARFLPTVVGRLEAGLSLADAQARLATFGAAVQAENPSDYAAAARWSVRILPLRDIVVGDFQPILLVLLGTVAVVLVIACANLANLLLARAATRQREIAVRLALGAGPRRLFRQLITESLLLAVIGGAAGVAAAAGTTTSLLALIPSRVPRLHEVGMDPTVLTFSAVVAAVTGILFGLTPALQAARVDVVGHLKESGARGTAGLRQQRLRVAFGVAQIALSLVLMTASGLLLRTLWSVLAVDPGIDGREVLSARTWVAVPNDHATDRYDKVEARTALARDILARLQGLPGVTEAGLTTALPLSHMTTRIPVQIEGRPNEAEAATSDTLFVSPGYFATLRIPVRRGRGFVESDQPGNLEVAVIDQTAADRFFPGRDPIGRSLQLARLGPRPLPPMTVVGVVGDVKYGRLDEAARPHVYGSLFQHSGRGYGIVVRARARAADLGEPVRRALEGADAELPVFSTQDMEERLAVSVGERRLSATLVSLFAVVAVLLAAVGVYGVVAYSVSQRTREIGVRIALGATRGDVARLVLGQALWIAAVGIGIGGLAALATARSLRSMLFHVRETDPLVFATTAVVLGAVALLAAYVPARRAARVDPMVSLHHGS